MPTEEQNIQYLYLVLTHGGNPTVDWDPICAALQLEKGAATKRWSRLKQAIERGDKPTSSHYELLWLLVKHSTRNKPFDWDAIAAQCASTKSACSKRYSRLKLAFEQSDTTPGTPAKGASAVPVTPKKTPQKSKVKAEEDDTTPTVTPKRKRAPVKKTRTAKLEGGLAPTAEDEDDEHTMKRTKLTPKTNGKSKSKPKPRIGFRASDAKEAEVGEVQTVKQEPVDEEEDDVFLDAVERADTDVDDEV